MLISLRRKQKSRLILCCLVLGALAASTFFSPQVSAKLFDGPVDVLPLEQRVSLRRGELVFMGKSGDYTSRILLTTSQKTAWDVLTDYENFAEFLPGVISSEVLNNTGERKIFEQVNQVKTFVFSVESKVKIATMESYPEEIAFEAVGGDLETMNGKWTLEPVSPYPSAPPNQVLLTHRVVVEPAKAPTDGIFYSIYEDSLRKTLLAIKQEVEKRETANLE